MNIGSKVKFLLETQVQFKIMHWQTKGYARHNSFGMIYSELNDLIDEFVEQAMGKYGRFVLEDDTKSLQLQNLSELSIKGMVKTVAEALIQFTDEFEPTDTNLLNLRDEILGVTYKLSYLLTQE
jgi:DNA-binding ferritin-like protein